MQIVESNEMSDDIKHINKELVDYYEKWGSNDWTTYLYLLKPTGRWKLVNSEYNKNNLFIEHKNV